MDVAAVLEEEFGVDVRVERVAPGAQGHDGTVRFTVYCSPDSGDRVRERVAELAAELAFDTIR